MVLGWWLDSMILEIFSNLNKSMIYDSWAALRLANSFTFLASSSPPLTATFTKF